MSSAAEWGSKPVSQKDDLGERHEVSGATAESGQHPANPADLGGSVATAPLGRWQQLAISLGGVLGTGWLIAVPRTAHLGWFAALPWLLGAASVGLIAAMVVHLARADQRPGGLAWWPTRTTGLVAGTAVNAGLFLIYAGNPPAGSAGVVRTLSAHFPALALCSNGGNPVQCSGNLGLNWLGFGSALLVMTALFALHLLGMRLMLRVNIAMGALKVVVLVLLVVAAASTPFQLFRPEGLPIALEGLSPLAAAFAATTAGGLLFAFNGFQGPVDHGVSRGTQYRGFAIYGALLIATALYVALQLTFIAGAEQHWDPPQHTDPGFPLLLAGTVLPPLTNALLFVSLAGIVLGKSVEQRVLVLPRPDWRIEWRVFPVVWLFGVVYLLLTRAGWAEISDSKSVVYVVVYSYAAVSYAALRQHGDFKDRSYLAKSLHVLAPLSFVVATVIAYYSRFPSLLVACGLLAVVGLLMLTTKLPKSHGRNWREHVLHGRWLLGYLGALLALTGVQFAVRLATLPAAQRPHDPGAFLGALAGFGDVPAFAGGPLYQLVTHGLAVVAALVGGWFFRLGVRRSVQHLRFMDRSAA